MKPLLTILLSLSSVFGEDRTCYRGSARVDFSSGEPVSFRARGRLQTCPNSDWGCGAVRKFARSILLDDDGSVALPLDMQSWSALDSGCVPPEICKQVIGSDEGIGCRYANYVWDRYDPQSCNASAAPPFNAEVYRQRVRMYYACCNDANNCIDPQDATQTNANLNKTCTENTALGDYISDLHRCWLRGRALFRKYFVCNEEGPDLIEYRELCMDDVYNEWSRTKAGSRSGGDQFCFYRPTCTDALKELITKFGECACFKAKTHGFSGATIGSLMQSQWNDFCPGLDISCSGNATLWLRQRRKRRKLRFKVARALTALTDAWKTAIKVKIARYLKIQTEDITVSASAAEGGSRRLLESSSAVEIDIVGDEVLDDAIATAACDTDGIATALEETVTDLTCLSEQEYETVSGMNTTDTTATPTTTEVVSSSSTTSTSTTEAHESGNNKLYVFVAVIFGFVTYLMQ